MNKFTMTEQQVAQRFGCTIEQVRAGHRVDAASLRTMLQMAAHTGRKVNGYSADKLSKMVADADALSRGERPSA